MARVGSPEPNAIARRRQCPRQRQREEVADQVEEIAHVVAEPDPLDHETHHPLLVGIGEHDRAADAAC